MGVEAGESWANVSFWSPLGLEGRIVVNGTFEVDVCREILSQNDRCQIRWAKITRIMMLVST